MTASFHSIDDFPSEGTVDLRGFLDAIVRRKLLVLGVAVLVTALVALYSYSRTPMYTSTAEVLIRPTLANPLESIPLDRISLQTEIRIATSAAVAEAARVRMDLQDGANPLLKNVAVTAPQDTQILEFAYSNPAAREAQRGAQALAEAYLGFKSDQAIESIAQHSATLQTSIDKLDREIRAMSREIARALEGSPEWEDLVHQRNAMETTRLAVQNQLATISTLSIDAGQVIQPAELPTSPSYPDHRLDLLLGVLLGLLLGAATAWVSERRRDRVESQTSLEAILEAPVLGVIPRMPPDHKRTIQPITVDEPKSLAAEAFRTLRTNLLAVSARPPIKTLLVTSAWTGEGKSTVAANIATALAQLRREVILISADLRFPRVHGFFGCENDRGLGQVLMGEVTLEEALCESPVPQLRVLPSGPVDGIAEPVELVQSDRMLDVIARCAENAFVIIDGSPILTVADSLVIATMVDAVLFVADAQNGRRASIAQSRYQLRQVDARVVGGVLNGVDGRRTTYGGYSGAHANRRNPPHRMPAPGGNPDDRSAVGPLEIRR